MRKIVSFCATILLVVAGFSLGAQSNSRIVFGRVTHTEGEITEGVLSTITLTPKEETSQSEPTDWEGYYSITVDPNKDYTCEASNMHGNRSEDFKKGSQDVEINFDF